MHSYTDDIQKIITHYATLLLKDDNLFLFLQELFINCFIRVNQATVIDWDGIIYCDQEADDMKYKMRAFHEKAQHIQNKNKKLTDQISEVWIK